MNLYHGALSLIYFSFSLIDDHYFHVLLNSLWKKNKSLLLQAQFSNLEKCEEPTKPGTQDSLG